MGHRSVSGCMINATKHQASLLWWSLNDQTLTNVSLSFSLQESVVQKRNSCSTQPNMDICLRWDWFRERSKDKYFRLQTFGSHLLKCLQQFTNCDSLEKKVCTSPLNPFRSQFFLCLENVFGVKFCLLVCQAIHIQEICFTFNFWHHNLVMDTLTILPQMQGRIQEGVAVGGDHHVWLLLFCVRYM